MLLASPEDFVFEEVQNRTSWDPISRHAIVVKGHTKTRQGSWEVLLDERFLDFYREDVENVDHTKEWTALDEQLDSKSPALQWEYSLTEGVGVLNNGGHYSLTADEHPSQTGHNIFVR